jgi:hypothetical protein
MSTKKQQSILSKITVRDNIALDSKLYFDVFNDWSECDSLFELVLEQAGFKTITRLNTTIPRLQSNQGLIENNCIPIYRYGRSFFKISD